MKHSWLTLSPHPFEVGLGCCWYDGVEVVVGRIISQHGCIVARISQMDYPSLHLDHPPRKHYVCVWHHFFSSQNWVYFFKRGFQIFFLFGWMKSAFRKLSFDLKRPVQQKLVFLASAFVKLSFDYNDMYSYQYTHVFFPNFPWINIFLLLLPQKEHLSSSLFLQIYPNFVGFADEKGKQWWVMERSALNWWVM